MAFFTATGLLEEPGLRVGNQTAGENAETEGNARNHFETGSALVILDIAEHFAGDARMHGEVIQTPMERLAAADDAAKSTG